MNMHDLRSAMRQFATSVVVVTCHYQGKNYGFTANSFNSVSLEPSLLNFAIGNQNKSFEAFKNCSFFAINLLCEEQEDIAKHFAKDSSVLNTDAKFDDVDFFCNQEKKSPLIRGSLFHLECKNYQQIPAGDHHIILGELENSTINTNKKPLIYWNRNFCKIQ